MVAADPYRQYQQIKVTSSTREDLVLLAYDGAIKFINISMKSLDDGELEKAHFSSIKAQAIISELMISLDIEKGGEVAENLFNLYEYMNFRLTIGNAMKNQEPFKEIRGLLYKLREAWVEARKKVS